MEWSYRQDMYIFDVADINVVVLGGVYVVDNTGLTVLEPISNN